MMKDTRQNIMKRTLSIWLFSVLALYAMQISAVNYQNSYRGTHCTGYNVHIVSTAPVATFQSTSTYASEEWAEKPLLNSDGSVNSNAYMHGPRRVIGNPDEDDEGEGGGENGAGQGGDNNWNGSDLPIGDAIIPLLLMAAGYMVYRLWRRRKMVP